MENKENIEQQILNPQVTIDFSLYRKLKQLGIIHACKEEVDVRSFNIGNSDYSKHIIQPWSIWIDWNLNAFDADIIKRVLRTKDGEPRTKDYEKIIHICNERIRQIKLEQEYDS